jgi:hypothetical protein
MAVPLIRSAGTFVGTDASNRFARGVLEIQRVELGDRDPATMSTMSSLAEMYANQERYTEAEDTYNNLIGYSVRFSDPLIVQH